MTLLTNIVRIFLLQKFTHSSFFGQFSLVNLKNLFVTSFPLRILIFLNTQGFQFSPVFLKTCCVVIQLKKLLYWRSCTLPTEQNFLHRPPYLFQYYISSMWGNVRIFYHLCSIRVGLRLHKTFLYDKPLVLLWEIILIIPHALRETKKVFCRNIYFFHLYICMCWIFIRVWLERTLQKCVSHKLNGIQ